MVRLDDDDDDDDDEGLSIACITNFRGTLLKRMLMENIDRSYCLPNHVKWNVLQDIILYTGSSEDDSYEAIMNAVMILGTTGSH